MANAWLPPRRVPEGSVSNTKERAPIFLKRRLMAKLQYAESLVKERLQTTTWGCLVEHTFYVGPEGFHANA